MQSRMEETVKVTLVLNEEEARWLHGVMQNPLWGYTPQQETEEDRVMREKFYNGTTLKY